MMQNPQSGLTKDHFTTVSVIGKGSYAKVALVKKRDSGELFAMKILKKEKVEARKQEKNVKTERDILLTIQHPFIIDFYYSFQDSKHLYFILEYCPGGELFNLLSKKRRFSEDQTRFYAAQMVLAIETIHQSKVIYRDLKPENVLLDQFGYIRITDFGLSRMNVNGDEARSICGTPEYLAPEIVMKLGYGQSVDWWTLGCIIYEMLVGIPPFYTDNRQELFERISFTSPKYPSHLSSVSKDLLEGLLKKDPSKRYGASPDKLVRNHPWFNGVNWDYLYNKRYQAPFKPLISDDLDLRNFDREFTEMEIQSMENQNSFGDINGFTYDPSNETDDKMVIEETNN